MRGIEDFLPYPYETEKMMSTEMTVFEPENPELVEYKKSVSHSEAEAFLRCERNHFYGYGMGIQRIAHSEALNKGILGHACMDAYFTVQMKAQEAGTWLTEVNPDDCLKAALQVAFDSGSEYASTISICLTWFHQSNQFVGWRILAIEKEFRLQMTDDLEYIFIPDMIARDPYGVVWIIDHKFVWDFYSVRDSEMMTQLAKYQGALQAMGFDVQRAAFNMIRTRINMKTMDLSTQVKFQELEITDHRKRRSFYEQIVVGERIAERKRIAVEEPDGMAQWSRTALRVSNKMICNSCSFRALCVAELNDEQPQLVLDTEYMKKTRREIKSGDDV